MKKYRHWNAVLLSVVAFISHQPVYAAIVSVATFTGWTVGPNAVCVSFGNCSVRGLGTNSVSWTGGGDMITFNEIQVATTLPPKPFLIDLGTITFVNGASTEDAGTFDLKVDLVDTSTSQVLETMTTTIQVVTRTFFQDGTDADSLRWTLAGCCSKDMTVGEGSIMTSRVLGSSGSLNLYDIQYLSGGGIISDPSDPLTPVSPRAVPIPAAVWLFGTGLLALVGMARRKHAT